MTNDASGSLWMEAIRQIPLQLARLETKLDSALAEIEFLRGRLSTYLGDGVALTWLADETPIYVNAPDFGPPANYLNGGLYEQDNLDVLLSFVRPDTVFLDIGANLGSFALQIARRAAAGAVHAFEPNPAILRLLRASAYLNGLSDLDGRSGRIICHAEALGAETGDMPFTAPPDHCGGATRSHGETASFRAPMQRADDMFPADFTCDLVKIDVEGGEFDVLLGMAGILQRSPHIKIVFEKLAPGASDDSMERHLRDLGFGLHLVGRDAKLQPVSEGALRHVEGYVLAARDGDLTDGFDRARFTIHARQFLTRPETSRAAERERLTANGEAGQILFYGPYWFLRRGVWDIVLEGEIDGEVEITLAMRFGHAVERMSFTRERTSARVVIARDLVHFECVGRAHRDRCEITLSSLQFHRIG